MKKILATLAVAALVLPACGDDDPGIEIGDPWARSSAMAQNAGAVYMSITAGDTADRLVSARVDSSVAAMAQLHESSMGEGGMMSMQGVDAIEVPAGGEAMLEPGGLHIMLMDLAEPLVTGAEFEITLVFENAGEVAVTVSVREG